MGSLSSPKLPIIDFGEENLRAGTSSWVSTCKKVVHALEEYGCFEAVVDDDKVPHQLHNHLFGNVERVFDLPVATKSNNSSPIVFADYQPNVPERLLFEGLGVANATDPHQIQHFTNAMLPDQETNTDHKFSETLLSYTTLAAELEQMVMRMVFESYGIMENDQQKLQDDPDYLFRMMKYRVPKEDEGKLACHTHTDKYMISVLHQNDVNGLEIQTKDDQWIGFHLSPSSFVIMAGEAFMAWSSGRIDAPVHRVVMLGSEPRYSVALFCGPKGKIEAPEKLIDARHPLLFKPFEIRGLLRHYAIDRKHKCYTIRDYCGIQPN